MNYIPGEHKFSPPTFLATHFSLNLSPFYLVNHLKQRRKERRERNDNGREIMFF